MSPAPQPRKRRRGVGWLGAPLLILGLAAPALAQLTPDESSELARLRESERDLQAIAARADAGEVRLVPNPRPAGPRWLEAPPGDPASAIAALVVTGDLTSAEAVELSRDVGAELRRGRALLDAELGKVRGRIRTLESRDLSAGGRLASGASRETWRFALVGRFDRTGDPMRSTGTLTLEFLGGGRVRGTAHYDSRDSWDDDVEGTIRGRDVRIRYGASNSVTGGIFTGTIDPSGTTATGEYRISGSIDAHGTWRATRPPETAAAAAGSPGPGSPSVPAVRDAAEDSLLAALAPDLTTEFQPLVRSGAVPLDEDLWRRQRRENRDRAARHVFGGDFASLTGAERALLNGYVVAMDLAVLPDRDGARAFPGVAASLPVIGEMTRNARTDPAAGVALLRYLALLERMDVEDLRRRHGTGGASPPLP